MALAKAWVTSTAAETRTAKVVGLSIGPSLVPSFDLSVGHHLLAIEDDDLSAHKNPHKTALIPHHSLSATATDLDASNSDQWASTNDRKASNQAGHGRKPGEPRVTKSDQTATKSDRKAIEGWLKRTMGGRRAEEDDVERDEEQVEGEEQIEGEERIEEHDDEEKEHYDPEKEEVPTVEKSAGKASSLFGVVKSTRLNLLTTNVYS